MITTDPGGKGARPDHFVVLGPLEGRSQGPPRCHISQGLTQGKMLSEVIRLECSHL